MFDKVGFEIRVSIPGINIFVTFASFVVVSFQFELYCILGGDIGRTAQANHLAKLSPPNALVVVKAPLEISL